MTARFNTAWMSKEEYKSWLQPVPSDNTRAKCTLCMKTISLSNMGQKAIKSHATGQKKHKAACQLKSQSSISYFLKKKGSEAETAESYAAPSTSHLQDIGTDVAKAQPSYDIPPGEVKSSTSVKPLTDYVLRKEQHKAEIFWALKIIMSHFSYSSAEDICDIFRVMFHDSAIAKKMKCGPTKLSYIVAFGIAPYFKQLLLSELQKAPCFVLSFDESLNHDLQKEQMDFVVKYFVEDKVVCRYLTSTFLGHTQAEDLKKMFEEGIKDLEPRRMIQISMDGPSVNWKLYEQITEERNEMEDYPSLIDIGSCSLHVVHRAFRTGVQKTKWSIDGILRALYNLFNDSPAKREDYKTITGSDIFPLQFCGHRWLEDKKVAERAISIWPNIHKYVVETLKKPKSKIPSSASFATVKSAVHDILIVAKLQFFVFVATVMQPFLKMFQADAPMLPFLTSEVVVLFPNLMQRFIKQSE